MSLNKVIFLCLLVGWFSLGSLSEATYGIENRSEFEREPANRNSESFNPVYDKESLLLSLQAAAAGDTIYISAGIDIDLTGESNIAIPGGVTILGLGNDTENYSDYPLLYTNDVPDTERINPLFLIVGDRVEISRLRIKGDYSNNKDVAALDIPGSVGIRSRGYAGITIRECEIFDWHFSGILFDYGSRDNFVLHSNIHSNLKPGYGYGVCIGNESFAEIEENRFDNNRHAIAGGGSPESGYTARYNYIGKQGTSHSFDMHGGADRGDGTDYAGCCIIIEHNDFHIENHWGIAIRGIPKNYAVIRYNNFYGNKNIVRNSSVRQLNAFGNVYVGPNSYEFDYRDLEASGWVVLFAGSKQPEWLIHTAYRFESVQIGDFNGDGISDIFVIDSAGKWLVSWSALVSWQRINEQVERWAAPEDLYIGDFNGDGKDDVLIVEGNDRYLSENGASGLTALNGTDYRPQNIYTADITGNGEDDLLYYHQGVWYAWINKMSERIIVEMPFTGNRLIKMGDYNGDGNLNIFWEEDGKIYYNHPNEGIVGIEPDASIEDIAIHDFTGDGKQDVFFADGERWLVYSYGVKEAQVLFASELKTEQLLFADFNGNGKTDVVFNASAIER